MRDLTDTVTEKEKKMKRKIALVEDCCIGCGSCAELCPEVFEMDEEGETARVILPEGGDKTCIEEAMAACPEECIVWDE
jgi:ferredoxin